MPARAWQTNAALIFMGCGLLALIHDFILENDRWYIGFSGAAGWSCWVYLAACVLVLYAPRDRWTFPIIIAFFVALRFITFDGDPFASSDIYRYAWDGIVQHAHINPYRYVPGDPALTFLRKPNLDTFSSINRRDYAHTIYPPVAQIIFYLITFLNSSETGMKMAMIFFDALTLYGLVLLLKELGMRRETVLLYAWSPLTAVEIGSSGHVDAIAMAFVVFALLFRYRRQDVLTGVFLALATMTKMYPLALFPALYRRGDWKMPATVAAIVAVGYAIYSSVGLGVFGFFGGYVKEEGINTGERFYLFDQLKRIPLFHGIGDAVYFIFVALVLLALTLWCWFTVTRPLADRPSGGRLSRALGVPPRGEFIIPAGVIAFVLMLLFSPHYPWYIAWLIPFVTLVPDLTLMAYIVGDFYLRTTALAEGEGPKEFLLNQILYGGTLLFLLADWALLRWPVHRRFFNFRAEPDAVLLPETRPLRIVEVPASEVRR